MKKHLEYTPEEIKSNINILSNEIDLLKKKRNELTKIINNKKKQVVYWENLDLSQIKMFN